MPDEVTPAQTSSAHVSGSGLSETLLAERQRRGEGSCAECRRLKMRCDKRVPCKPCVRRGCGHLCPNGTNVTADGPKMVLAATNHLHEDIATLRNRIRDLEGALGQMHFNRTGAMHPLLGPRPEDDWDDDDILRSDSSLDIEKQEAIDDTDTLAIGSDGSRRFFGSVASALVHALTNDESYSHGKRYPDEDVELVRCVRHYPFTPMPPPDIQYILKVLRTHIPSHEIYDPLLDIVHGECGSLYLIAFTPEYVKRSLIPAARYAKGLHGLYALGSFFALIGIGCLFAVPGTEATPEARRYGRLSTIAIAASGVLASPALELIEALHVRAMLEMFQQSTLEETARNALNMACQMCYDIGLHMDGTRWKEFSAEELHRRRSVFWMVFKTDTWESIAIGRPPRMTFNTEYIDTELPSMPSAPSSIDMFRMIGRTTLLFSEIAFVIQSRTPPPYSRILGLDERVRAHFATPQYEQNRPAVIAPSSMINIHLHRGFFFRALTEHPEDPSKSEFSVSVHGVLRGARETLDWLRTLLELNPESCARLHNVWSIALAAATILMALFERAPQCPHAKNVRQQFENALPLFATGAKFGSLRAKVSLGILCTRLNKVSSSTYESATAVCSTSFSGLYAELLPALDIASEFITSAKDDAVLPPSSAFPPPARNLTRPNSLSSISDRTVLSVEQPLSAPDNSFYPSYLRRESARTVPSWDGTRGDTPHQVLKQGAASTGGVGPPSQNSEWNAIYLGGW